MADQDIDGEPDYHEFGAEHTLIKLETLSRYLRAYTLALKNMPFRRHYIDAFAGTGTCAIRVDGELVEVRGSASLAAECYPPFDRLTLIEKSVKKVRALERLKAATPGRNISVLQGDANDVLPNCIAALDRHADRALAFLDPFGLQLAWQSLKAVADSKIVDVWYLFPLSGVYRQTTLDAGDIDADKAAALDRIFGTHDWYDAFYGPRPQRRLFGDDTDERKADVTQITDWIGKRLATIFAGVAQPKVLRQHRTDGKPGARLFALFFLVSNPSSKAQDVAMRIANHILRD